MVAVRKRPENRRERRRTQTRSALLNAAMSLLGERGIHGMRIEDITERADVGKGVFYNYFATKEALVAVLVDEGVGLLERDYLRGLNHQSDLRHRIEALARAQEAFFRDRPDYALLFHQARGLLLLGGTRAAGLRRAFADYLAHLSALLPAEGQSGEWSQDDLLDVAAAVAGAAAGYRSFCVAVARPINLVTLCGALVSGVPKVLEDRRAAAPPTDP